MPVASISERTSASVDDDTRPHVEGGIERNLHVPDDIDRSGENFREGMANHCGEFRAGGPCGADAGVRDLLGRDPGGGAGLAHRLLQGFPRLCLADTHYVAGTCGDTSQEPRLIADRT